MSRATHAANRFASEPRFGANLLAPDRTRFSLWAPDCSEVTLEIENGETKGGAIMAAERIKMRPEMGGRFVAEAACGAGTRYRFRVRPDLAVPDPASRAQAGDVHDASLVVDPRAYAWRNPGWQGRPWHEAVIYELHVGAMGGFGGVQSRLAELRRLGITAIELMPLADFPGRRNWGYDGVLPYAPDAGYGPPEALKALIDAAHGLGLMVLLDVVYNHFGPDGNYLAAYAGAFFRRDTATPWGTAIDFRQPEVRAFFTDNALLWLLEYRFDGLRFDAVHAIGDRDFLRELASSLRGAVEPGRDVHLVLENDENDSGLLRAGPDELGFDAQWSDDAHHALHVLLTGERSGYYADYPEPAAALARALAEGFAYQGEPSEYRHTARRGTKSGHLPPTAFVAFLQNHDQVGNRAFGERLTRLAAPAALHAATLLLLLSPQIPLLFMGAEWGEARPFLFFTDHGEALAAAVREGRRREFSRFAAFADPAEHTRIPDPNDTASFLRSVPTPPTERTPEQQGWLAFHAHLLALRAANIVPHLPGSRSLGAEVLGPACVRAAWRLGNGAVLTIAANLGAANLGAIPLPRVPGPGALLAASPEADPPSDTLAPASAASWLEPPP
ncbi:MAG TPA: malto-oligosyltrehalose trehalohydrolase [Acetobacteraceae bacterium]|nr:malto-oligosyltrehalose trehalohydrolase [Acetobacteraceae bacterium]